MYNQDTTNTKSNIDNGFYSVNELSVQMGYNYRTIGKIIKRLTDLGIIEEKDGLRNNKPCKLYNIDASALNAINEEIEKRTNKNTNVQKADNTKDFDISKLIVQLTNTNDYANSLKDKLHEQEKELSKKDVQLAQIAADKYKLETDLKLIEDKSRTIEGAWAKEKQRVEELEKTVKTRNKQLLITGAVLLVVVVVILCYFAFGR